MKQILIAAAATVLATGLFAKPQSTESQCNITECAAGSHVLTYATKTEPYMACQTKELSDYTNMVLGLVAMHALMTGGKMPNISPETGEPEYKGETKSMLDMFRGRAGVRTLDQAMERCKPGKGGQRMAVMNNPKESSSIWVMDEKTKTNYWMPKGSLNLQNK